MTFRWLRPPRPERQPAARRIEREAGVRSKAPPHATELRRELAQLASLLGGEVSEEDAVKAMTWLETHWPWEIAASFDPPGYRWLVTGQQGHARVFVLLCEATEVRAGSLDVAVVDARGMLPSWPRPHRARRRSGYAPGFTGRRSAGGCSGRAGRDRRARDRSCTHLRPLLCGSPSRVCPVCNAELTFRVGWGALQRPPWQQAVVRVLLVLNPLLAYGLFRASALTSVRPSQGSLVPVLLAGAVVLLGLSVYLERARPA